MSRGEAIFGAVLAVLACVVVVVSLPEAWISAKEPGPGFFPLLVGAGLLVCGAILVWQHHRVLAAPVRFAVPGGWRLIGIVSALAVYPWVVVSVGFGTGTLMFFVGTARLLGASRWSRLIPVSVAVTVVCHLMFWQLLGMPLPAGPFGF
jgi:putative tricarboxylic transport membrane protein